MATKKTKKTAPAQPELSPAATKAFHTCRACGTTRIATENDGFCDHPQCRKVSRIMNAPNVSVVEMLAREEKDVEVVDLASIVMYRDETGYYSGEEKDRIMDLLNKRSKDLVNAGAVEYQSEDYLPANIAARRQNKDKTTECIVCGVACVPANGSRTCDHPDCAAVEKLMAVAVAGDREKLLTLCKASSQLVLEILYWAPKRFFPCQSIHRVTDPANKVFKLIDDVYRTVVPHDNQSDFDGMDFDSPNGLIKYRMAQANKILPAAPPITVAASDNAVAANHWKAQGIKPYMARNLAKLFVRGGIERCWSISIEKKEAKEYRRDGSIHLSTFKTKSAAASEITTRHDANKKADKSIEIDMLHRHHDLHLIRARTENRPPNVWHQGAGFAKSWSLFWKYDPENPEKSRADIIGMQQDVDLFEDSDGLDRMLESLDNAGKPIPSGLTCPVCGREDCQHRFCKMVQTALDVADPAAAEMIIPTIGNVEALDVAYWMEEAAVKGESRPWLITLLDTAAGVLASELNVRRLRDEECTEDAIAELLEKNGPDWPAIPGTVAASGDPESSYAEDLQAGEETGVLVLPKAPVERVDAEYVDENEESEKNQPELPGMPPPDKKRFLYILHDPRQDGHGSVREIMASSMGSAAKEIMLRLLIDLKEIDVYQEQRAIAAMEIEDMLQDMPPWSTFIVHLNKRGIAVSFSEVDGFASRIYKKALVHGSFRMLKASALPVQGA